MAKKKGDQDVPIPRVTVEGTVVAAESGKPLAGATVAYYFNPEEEYERRTPLRAKLDKGPNPLTGVPPTKTDRRGRFRLEAIPFWPGSPRKVGAELQGRFPSSRTIEHRREGETVRVDLRLGRAGAVRGTARWADGTPAEGAEVSWFGSFGNHWTPPWEDDRYPCHRFHRDRLCVRSGPDGRYELGPFPRGVTLRPMVSHPWGTPRPLQAVTTPNAGGEAVLDLAFDRAGQVEATLLPRRGPLPDSVHLDVRSAAEPDKEGHGYGLGSVAEFPGPSWTVHIPSIRPGRSILVVRAAGPAGPGGERRYPLMVRAGRVTRVRIPMPTAVSKRPWKAKKHELVFLERMPICPKGRPAATVAGVVRDAATGEPVRGATVSDVWRPQNEHLGSNYRQHGGFRSLEVPPVRTDSKGRFRIPRVPFEAGSMRKALFEADGYWTTARVYEFRREGEVHRFDIRLRRAGVLRGTVRDHMGRPRSGVQLHASLRRSREDDWRERERLVCTHLFQSGNVAAETDSDGRYSLSPLPFDCWIDVGPGHGAGSGIPNMLLAVSEEKPEARLDFVLDPGGTLMIEVRRDPDCPASEVRMELRRLDGGLVFSGGWSRGDESVHLDRVNTQTHAGLAPGKYLLTVAPEGAPAPGRPIRVRIQRGKTTTVRVRLRSPRTRPSPSARR